jgi:type II secretory ATPase GspE/PulE/Tfp pilus assembly ATPase PilB-like protein
MPKEGNDNCMNCEHSGLGSAEFKSSRVTCSIRAATIIHPPYTYCKNFTSQERGVAGGDVPIGPIWIDVSDPGMPSTAYNLGWEGVHRCPVPDWGKYHLVNSSGNEELLKKFLTSQVEKYRAEDWENKNPGMVTDDFRETLVRLVNKLFLEAVYHHGEEIFFEPGNDEVLVIVKVKSEEQKLRSIPMSFYDDILFMIKARANLDTESHLAQKGLFIIKVEKSFFEATLSIVPLSNGEKISVKLKETDPTEEESTSEDPDQWLKGLGKDDDTKA